MAFTTIPHGSILTEKLWRPGLTHEAERQTPAVGILWGTGEESGVVIREEMSRNPGDTVQCTFSPTDDSFDGFTEGATISGNELDIDYFVDTMQINYLGVAFGLNDQMSQQRVSHDIKKAIFRKATTWWSRRWEEVTLNQLAGYTPASTGEFERAGMNPITAIDAAHLFQAEGTSAWTTDEEVGLDDSAKISLDHVTDLVTRAQSKAYVTYPISPCADGYYHWFIHTSQAKDLRQNSNSGDWEDLHRARLEGGDNSWESSAFVQGFLGIFNRTCIWVSDYVTPGVLSTNPLTPVANTRRTIFVGANAANVSFGKGYTGGDHLDWTERVNDYKRWGVLADSVFGLKRTIFDNQTMYNFVLTTWTEV